MVEHEVRWPSPSELDRGALSQLSRASLKVAERAPVPALVVNRGPMLERAQLLAKSRWYAMTTTDKGVTVSIHATKTAHSYPHLEQVRGAYAVRGNAAFVTQNDAIWSAAWIEGGVAYSLELECHALPDPRCDDPDYLMSLSTDLAYVGGAGR